jgi:hypothetical protein
MDEAALHRRLDAIERRQYLVLALLVLPYLVGGLSLLVGAVEAGTLVAAGIGAVLLVFLGLLYAGYRARQPSRR